MLTRLTASLSRRLGISNNHDWYDKTTLAFSGSALVISVVVAVFLVLTFRETRRQAVAAQEQARIAREETAYLHMPHFRVRFASVEVAKDQMFPENSTVSVRLDVLNNGQVDANVVGSHLEIYWNNTGLPGSFPYLTKPNSAERIVNQFVCRNKTESCTIKAGDGLLGDLGFKVQSSRLMGAEGADLASGKNGWKLYLLGWIGYRRPEEKYNRFFDFAFEFQPERNRFFPVKDDPDYTYDPDGR